MLDVGTATETSEDDADLAVFVDRLAAAGADRSTVLAQAQVRRAIGAGSPPPGLRRLAEALAASVAGSGGERSSGETPSVVAAVRSNALVVLQDFDATAVAEAVTALVDDGRRVVVTAAAPTELTAVRAALPADAAGRSLDRLPAVPAAELRELRRLLASSSPARRARAGDQLPFPTELPSAAEVGRLCAQARTAGSGGSAWMVPGLLANLDPERRTAVTAVARLVRRSLDALQPRAEQEWVWSLLSELIYSRHRAAFDRLIENTAQAVAAVERSRSAPPVTLSAPAPAAAVEMLHRYQEYLAAGGRTRSYFRSPVQREVQPVLDLARIGGAPVDTEGDVARLVEHLQLGELLAAVDADCRAVGIAAPRNAAELTELTEGLAKVAAAVRAVGALRHDVLFIAPDSPLAVPDIETADQVARAVLEYADHGSAAEAGRRLAAVADDLARRCPPGPVPPEYGRAIAALRAHDPAEYAAAVDALAAARRVVRDENRRSALLRSLSEAAPRLADSWSLLGEQDPAALGLAAFVPVDALLAAVPPADSADVVVVLGAARLGVERLLLGAVAPRMIAAVAPDEHPDGAPSLLSVLRRASALVIGARPEPGGNVLRMTPGIPRSTPARIGQAGA